MENNQLENSELFEERFQWKNRRSNNRFIATCLAFLALIFGLRAYWTQTFGGIVVDGSSMLQTLFDEDKLVVRYVDDVTDLQRGDIIIVDVQDYPEVIESNMGRLEQDKTKYLIKRLIALPGDKVKCVEGNVYIWYQGESGYRTEPLKEDYAYYRNGKEYYNFAEYEVGEGEIFFLGDNRQNSIDSRYQEFGGSHLTDRLYKAKDVYGVVPEWALEYKALLEIVLFHDFSK